ncbi:MAG: MAPEG family protein [Pseudomonadota bacterium]
MLEAVQPYSTALICLMILVLAVSAQSFISTFVNLLKREGTPGQIVEGDHQASHWRLYRTHQNSVENFSPFAATVVAGILVGASAGWINMLAVIHLLARLAHWVIYSKGLGPVASGPRTISYVVGFFSNIVMALVVLFAVL